MHSRRLDEFLPKEFLDRVPAPARGNVVRNVTSDSREVGLGSVFIAVKGQTQDGNTFIEQACRQGAALVIGTAPPSDATGSVPYLRVIDDRAALAWVAAAFYGNPSHSLLMVGVTGTSGKTTTTYLIESILRAAEHRVGVIGTVNFRFEGRVIPSTHTTPGAAELQQLLAQMKSDGATAVVMEVSSHALKQKRAAEIAFDAMAFTNLSPEHLDYHPDLEDYFRSKAILFHEMADVAQTAGKEPVAAINLDDSYGQRLMSEIEMKRNGFRIADSGLQVGLQGVKGKVSGVSIDSPLVGQFNVSNILTAVWVALGLKIDPKAISRGIHDLAGVPGRVERVPHSGGIHVFVDYAHKPDALEKVLDTLSRMEGRGKLITVFGCGGDRDRTKRPVMGKIASERSDRVIVTSDNPRTEDPQAIIREILKGIPTGAKHVQVEPDRKRAIFQAIEGARPGDIVLIAGKGHEDYQIIGTGKIHFDDREVALEALQKIDIGF